MPRMSISAAVSLCSLLSFASPAAAQLASSGASFLVATVGTRGTASAYDSKNNVFLAVAAYGRVTGRFVRPDASFVGDPFPIDLATGFAHYPSVAYSPDADGGRGAFLVTWHQSLGEGPNRVRTRLVSATTGLLGAEQTLGIDPTWWESAPSVDYASGSKVFLTSWRIDTYQIRAARIGLSGEIVQDNIAVTATRGERDPSVAYNPDTDNFLVAYSDFLGGGTHTYARLVSASDGFVSPPQLLASGTGTYITDATYSTSARKYLVGWYQLPGGPMARFVNADGTPSGDVVPLSSRFGSYDSLGIAHNRLTKTSLMVGHDLLSFENGGVEVSDAGVPIATAVLTNAGGPTGNFYPQVSASTTETKWMLTTAHNYASMVAQFATSGAGGVHVTPLSVRPLTMSPSSGFLPGSPITFTASTTGGTGPLEYQFVLWNGTSWSVAQPYSTTKVFSMTPAAGTYAVQVWVRNAGSTASYDGWAGTPAFVVAAPRAILTGFTVDRTFPSPLNVPITWTASATGAGSPVEYKFLYTFNGGVTWVVGQDYSPSNSFTWYPPLGSNNVVQVWVRRVGSTLELEDWRSTGLFLVRSTGALMASLNASHSVPTLPSTTRNWTASGIGGGGPLEYKFFLYNQGTGAWSVLRDWGASPKAFWTPGMTGLFSVQTWVRTVGAEVTYEDWRNSEYFAVTDTTGLTLTADRPVTTLRSGDLVTWTAQATGATGPLEYQFFTYNGSSWTVQPPAYKADNTFSWFVSEGPRAVQVWVRAAGSKASWERWASTGVFIVNP